MSLEKKLSPITMRLIFIQGNENNICIYLIYLVWALVLSLLSFLSFNPFRIFQTSKPFYLKYLRYYLSEDLTFNFLPNSSSGRNHHWNRLRLSRGHCLKFNRLSKIRCGRNEIKLKADA